jgi:tRNA(Ile)-lysidine synthase
MTMVRLQDLPPQWARFCLNIERFVTRELHVPITDTTLVIAYSTGVDSTALLHIFHMLAPRLHLRLVGAHLDHGLRPESAREQQTARQTCSQLGIPLECARRDIATLARQQGLGLEETGRLERYAFLEEVRTRHNARYILTAHQVDDLAEDVLMRLIRGTGWPGLAGMAGVDPDRHLVRPLLQTPKQVLEQFLTHLGISWEEDASNADPCFLRNRVRSTILPLFLKENPSFLQTVHQLWQCGQADRSFWDRRVAHHLQGRKQCIPSGLARLEKAERFRLIKHVLESMGPGQPLAASIARLDTLWQHKATGKTVQFPGNKIATITRDGIVFDWKQ